MKRHLLQALCLICSGTALAQNLSIKESFENAPSDYGYTSNSFANTVNQYFLRASDPVVVLGQATFGNSGSVQMTGEDGTYFWACEGVRGSGSTPDPAKPAGNVTLNAIPNAQNYTGIKVTLAVGAPRGGAGSTLTRINDHFRIQYSYGSASGPFTSVGEFAYNPALNGISSHWTRMGGTTITGDSIARPTFSDHAFDIPAGTGDLYVRIEVDYSGSNHEIAFDNIRVTGTASTVVRPTITSASNSTLIFAEGTATPLTVFSNLTVANPAMTSGATLSQATVSLSPYAGAQDEITYTIPSGSGITATSGTASGVYTLTFSGTASVANYEALLESVKYKNIEVNNATAGDRLFSYVVKSGSVISIALERTVSVTTALNAASALPYTENFDSDGEGTRYASNTRVANSQGFVRLTNASGGSATAGSGFSNGGITFTNVQGSGYWYTNGTKGNVVIGNVGRITLAQINSTGFSDLHFKMKVGAKSSSNSYGSTDYVRFSYSTDGGTSWTIFADYTGDGLVLRLNANSANPALDAALTDADFALTGITPGALIDFRVESSSDGGEQILFDNIQVTGTPLAVGTLSATSFCAGAALTVPYTASTTANTGNIFTAQLSNASGSFASPVTIGTLTATATSGNIAAAIPASTSGGTGYRVRIISSNPSYTSGDNGTNLTITGTAVDATSRYLAAASVSQATSVNQNVRQYYADGSCRGIATVQPTGAAMGNTTARVFVKSGTQTTPSGQKYVRRYYDISPASNAATATARVTLYYTQADFTDYNTNRGTNPPLPIDGTDAANGKANLKITQQHGSSASGDFGTYTGWAGAGARNVLIDPVDADIIWNNADQRWEVSFAVTGFSGFFAYSSLTNTPLPIKLLGFSAERAGNRNRIAWTTAAEQGDYTFEVERSANGNEFKTIGNVDGSNKPSGYIFYDEQPLAGINYYRLNMIAANGESTFSNIAIVRGTGTGGAVTIAPVPAERTIRIINTDAALQNGKIMIYNMQGMVVYQGVLLRDQSIDVSSWAAGSYALHLPNGEVLRIVKN
ncbi:MAG: T9SS type A sorting domain-containing protein [Sphingobacteriales bacterium]|nr:MAG: T9SS type A sorting domain-containing protein [Sphingobacteriales bacterium]